jgi:hypothetical protein
MREYSDQGISRYISGKYAYHMSHAMMLGYVSCSATLPSHFDDFFKISKSQTALYCKPTNGLHFVSEIVSPIPLFASIHDRKFTFPDGQKPKRICLLHAWLKGKL